MTILKGDPKDTLAQIHERGFYRLYINRGKTIQSFLKEDLIDELRITTIPVLLGGGFSLFGKLEKRLGFEHMKTTIFLDQIVQTHYKRKR